MYYSFYLQYYFESMMKENAAIGTAMGIVTFMLCSSMDARRSLAFPQ